LIIQKSIHSLGYNSVTQKVVHDLEEQPAEDQSETSELS